MALKKLSNSKKTITYICGIDDALDCSSEVFAEYQRTLDESLLTFKEGLEPTRFVVKLELDFESAAVVKNKQINFNPTMKTPQIDFSFMLYDVRYRLMDIVEPSYLSLDERINFKRDSDGYASKELVAYLDKLGIVNEIFSVVQLHTNQANVDEQKKS